MRWEFVAIPNFKIVVVKAKAPSLDAAIQLTHSSSSQLKKSQPNRDARSRIERIPWMQTREHGVIHETRS